VAKFVHSRMRAAQDFIGLRFGELQLFLLQIADFLGGLALHLGRHFDGFFLLGRILFFRFLDFLRQLLLFLEQILVSRVQAAHGLLRVVRQDPFHEEDDGRENNDLKNYELKYHHRCFSL